MPAYRPADPAAVAATLDLDQVHVWRLAYRPHQARVPFRALVARYLGVSPGKLHFVDDARGRPSIDAPRSELSVSWSHSGAHALLAIARSLPVLGVDFEIPRPRARALALAQRFFHPDEAAALAALPLAAREAAFLKLWTAKEAVLKALGDGIRFGLDRVAFRLAGDTIVPAVFAEDAGSPTDWHLHRLDDVHGHACVAWRGAPRKLEWMVLAGEELSATRRV